MSVEPGSESGSAWLPDANIPLCHLRERVRMQLKRPTRSAAPDHLPLTTRIESAIIASINTDLSPLLMRARVHAALGDPARLAIVDALTPGDASPGEVGQQLGLPTNEPPDGAAEHVTFVAFMPGGVCAALPARP